MPYFSANLSYLFTEFDILDRFKIAEESGFTAVEYQYPYYVNSHDLQKVCSQSKLTFTLINAPAGDLQKGERGIAGLYCRKAEFKESIKKAIFFAELLNCNLIHVLAGILPNKQDRTVFDKTLVENLKFASESCLKKKIKLVIEPINSFDIPNYGISNIKEANKVISMVGSDNLYLQYDLYHGGMNSENLLQTIVNNFSRIAHMQVASVPGRNEPNYGLIDFSLIFHEIDKLGYKGWIGCEYTPKTTTKDGLKWLQPLNLEGNK